MIVAPGEYCLSCDVGKTSFLQSFISFIILIFDANAKQHPVLGQYETQYFVDKYGTILFFSVVCRVQPTNQSECEISP